MASDRLASFFGHSLPRYLQALHICREHGQPPRQARPHAVLTRRQPDIARLVSRRPQQQQIAARTFLSERIIETHITNTLSKIGLNPGPRSAAAWQARTAQG
jgi:DNA-binding NarL/FixJ family response regulator